MSAFYNVDQPPFNMGSAARAISAANNGLLFDIGDMPTMFQDAAGTIPVTAVEQPVGKILDKSGNGNHATQSETASRPVLSARYNLLRYSEDFANAVWNKLGTSVFQDTDISPSGGLTDSIDIAPASAGYAVYDATNLTWLVAETSYGGLTNNFKIVNLSVTVPARCTQIRIYTLRNTSTSYILQAVTVSPGDLISVKLFAKASAISGNSVCCAMVTKGVSVAQYQRVTTATDYDTNPAFFPKYLKFDAVDDYLNLPFMNLYGGAASIICARDAVSQATDTYIISERSTSNANPKYFPSRQLAGGGNMDSYISDDTAAVVLDTTGSAFSGASDKVIRSVVDTGNNIKLFKNGALAANDNYTRAGTLTLNNTTIGASVSTTTGNYASMKLYGLIITKSALTDAQRIKCERFLARKAGVML